MPLMMDQELEHQDMAQSVMNGDNMGHDLNMEDLFGAEPVNLPMDKRLPRLLLDMADTGCCRCVSFSCTVPSFGY